MLFLNSDPWLKCISYYKCLGPWVKYSADDILKYFSYFSKKRGFDISCKMSPLGTICIKCQILFSHKKNIANLSPAESAHSAVSVK